MQDDIQITILPEQDQDALIKDCLVENYGKISILEISRRFNNQRYQVEKNLNELIERGVLTRVKSRRFWTKEEDALLSENRAEMTHLEIGELLERKENDVSRRVHWLIKKGDLKQKFQKKFSKEEDQFLLENYNKISINEICEFLKRPNKTVRFRAYKLGLKLDMSFRFSEEIGNKILSFNREGRTIPEIQKEIKNIAGTTAIRNFILKNGQSCSIEKINKLRDDLRVGEVIGKLTLLKKSMRKNKKGVNTAWWLCQCECGKKKDIKIHYLAPGTSKFIQKSCGCVYKTAYEELSGEYWSSIRIGANARELDFFISQEYAWRLYLEQNKKCKLSGIDIVFGKRTAKTASLDRIDSSKGYIEGNVQWVHKHVNYMKRDFTQQEFIVFCNRIAKTHPIENV